MSPPEHSPRPAATLDAMQPGQRATVAALEGDDLLVSRLLEMGLLEGTPVEFVRRAPLGDPLEIRINGRYNLSLRRADARLIEIKPAD